MTDEEPQDLEAMAQILEASGRYQVLRRLEPRAPLPQTAPKGARMAVFLDVETTGLDPARDEVIELAMVPFLYGETGEVLAVGEAFQGFNEPRGAIPPEITVLTGITEDMVRGHTLDETAIAAFIQDAALIVAHNAAFDRRFAERLCPVFAQKPWACSMSQINWRTEGFEGAKLDYLALRSGFFYHRHRASSDCLAAIELLASPLPRSGVPALGRLLERARRPTVRIWAENAPFDLKHLLKARGYRWNADGAGRPRAWWVDVEEEDKESELAYLEKEIYRGPVELLVRRITAKDRFSDRC